MLLLEWRKTEPHRPRGPGSYFFNSLPASDPHPPVTPSVMPLHLRLYICAEDQVSNHRMTLTTNQSAFGRSEGDLHLPKPPLPTKTPAWDVLWPGCQSHLGETCPSPPRADLQFREECISSWLYILKSLFSDKIRVTRPPKRIKPAFYSSRKYQQGGIMQKARDQKFTFPTLSLTPRQAWSLREHVLRMKEITYSP